MWQKAVAPYVEAGQLIAIGVVQEQHPDRTRLYRQWRELQWPIFVDSMNVIEHVTVVPIPMALNEAGIVVNTRFNPRQLDEFIQLEFEGPDLPDGYNRIPEPNLDVLRQVAEKKQTVQAWHELGTAYFNYGPEEDLDRSVQALERAIELDPGDGQAHFALGTALRRRYEMGLRKPTDAQSAVEQWGLALDINPNHYIWRRRIQQYGPRLDKPYNFYFWVQQARQDITARGEKPIQLAAEPMGSEIAAPEKRAAEPPGAPLSNPDPKGRINRDKENLVGIEPLVTPARVQPGHRVRTRVTLRLNEKTRPLWNNEAGDLTIWVGLPEGLALSASQITFPNPKTPETRELRQVEFEMAIDEKVPDGQLELPAYALYYVCADEGGVCYYLRNDFKIAFSIDRDAPSLR